MAKTKSVKSKMVSKGASPHERNLIAEIAFPSSGLRLTDPGDVSLDWGVAIRRVPKRASVYRERSSKRGSPYDRVSVEFVPDGVVVHDEPAGEIGVDSGTILIGDRATLEHWEPEKSVDGLFDGSFWAKGANRVAKKVGASELWDGVYGWVDCTRTEIRRHERAVELVRQEVGWWKGLSVEPHSHLNLLMREIQRSRLGIGTIAVNGVNVVGLRTVRGDGFYPVSRGLDADGKLVRIAIDLV